MARAGPGLREIRHSSASRAPDARRPALSLRRSLARAWGPVGAAHQLSAAVARATCGLRSVQCERPSRSARAAPVSDVVRRCNAAAWPVRVPGQVTRPPAIGAACLGASGRPASPSALASHKIPTPPASHRRLHAPALLFRSTTAPPTHTMAPPFDPSDDTHRRYNPLTDSWVLCSPHRTKRPWLGAQEKPSLPNLPEYDPKCYLCPGNTRATGQVMPKYTSTTVCNCAPRFARAHPLRSDA